MARILVVDNHPIARLGTRLLLECSGHEVVCEVDFGMGAVKYAQEFHPDLVVVDFESDCVGGLEVLRSFRVALLDIPVLVFSSCADQFIAGRFLGGDVLGFISKSNGLDVLGCAASAVLSGYSIFPIRVIRKAFGYSKGR